MLLPTEIVIISILSLCILTIVYYHNKVEKDTKLAFYLGIPFILVELSARIFELYRIFPSVDIFSHAFFGVFVMGLFMLIYKKRFKVGFGVVFAIGVLWEIGEITFDKIFPHYPQWYKDIFFWDGFWDIVVKLIASAITGYIILKKKER